MEDFDNYKKTIDLMLSSDNDLNYIYTGDIISSMTKTMKVESNLTKNYSMSFIKQAFEEIIKLSCYDLKNTTPKETLRLIKDDLPIDIHVFKEIESSISYSVTSLNKDLNLKYKSGIFSNYFYTNDSIAQTPYIKDEENIQTYYCVDKPIQSIMYIIQNMTYIINDGYHTINFPLYTCDYNLYKIEVMNLKEHRNNRLDSIV